MCWWSGFNQMPGVYCPNPGGAFYAWPACRSMILTYFASGLLESFSYNNQTVMLAPAGGFYGTKGLGKKEVRLAYVLNTEDLSKAMDCLERH